MLDVLGRTRAVAHEDHGAGAGVFELVEIAAVNERRHAGLHDGLAAVGKVHGALALDDVEALVRVVAVHVVPVAGLGIDVHPTVEPLGVHDDLALLVLVRLLDQIHDLYGHVVLPSKKTSFNRACRSAHQTL